MLVLLCERVCMHVYVRHLDGLCMRAEYAEFQLSYTRTRSNAHTERERVTEIEREKETRHRIKCSICCISVTKKEK